MSWQGSGYAKSSHLIPFFLSNKVHIAANTRQNLVLWLIQLNDSIFTLETTLNSRPVATYGRWLFKKKK